MRKSLVVAVVTLLVLVGASLSHAAPSDEGWWTEATQATDPAVYGQGEGVTVFVLAQQPDAAHIHKDLLPLYERLAPEASVSVEPVTNAKSARAAFDRVLRDDPDAVVIAGIKPSQDLSVFVRRATAERTVTITDTNDGAKGVTLWVSGVDSQGRLVGQKNGSGALRAPAAGIRLGRDALPNQTANATVFAAVAAGIVANARPQASADQVGSTVSENSAEGMVRLTDTAAAVGIQPPPPATPETPTSTSTSAPTETPTETPSSGPPTASAAPTVHNDASATSGSPDAAESDSGPNLPLLIGGGVLVLLVVAALWASWARSRLRRERQMGGPGRDWNPHG